jgi:hypothetical protein
VIILSVDLRGNSYPGFMTRGSAKAELDWRLRLASTGIQLAFMCTPDDLEEESLVSFCRRK